MPDIYTKIELSNCSNSMSVPCESSFKYIYTDSEGFYNFQIDIKDIINYKINTFKEGYLQDKIPLNGISYGGYSKIDEQSVNVDTIFMGRQSFLKINLNILNESNSYVMYCGEGIPVSFIVDSDNISSSFLTIDTNNIDNYVNGIMKNFIYEEADKIRVAWYKRNNFSLDTAFLMETFTPDLKPNDTCIINLELK